MKHHPVHRNPNGHWCRCPWGPHAAEPYIPPRDREVVGTVKKPVEKTSMWHEAAKLQSLRNRNDLQTPEAIEFLNALEEHFPDNDVGAIYPWLVREWKKGRVRPRSHTPSGRWQDTDPMTYIDESGHEKGLDPADLQTVQEWVKYQGKTGNKGVELMQHEIGPIFADSRKWDQGGEIVHKFDDHEDAPDHGGVDTDPAGWTVARIRDRRDCRREGRLMNHCLGHSSQRYDKKIENGESLLYSVRDPDNKPHGTLELTKNKEQYYKCPGCGQYTPGTVEKNNANPANPANPWETHCDNCNKLLATAYNSYATPRPMLDVPTFKVDLTKIGNKPDARMTRVAQLYGHTDRPVTPFVEELANHFLSQHGHDYYKTDAYGHDQDDDEEEEEQEPEFEPWWDPYYQVPGPSNADDYISHMTSDEYRHDNAPEAYQRAMADADHHGFEGPDLEVGDHDWDDIFGSITGREVDPEKINDLFQTAKEHGSQEHLNELLTRAQDWLEEEHNQYLDPYGQYKGQGHFPQTTVPNTTPEGSPVFPAVNEPGSHYPSSHPHEEYAAKNLLYQLDKHMPYDPQMDVRLDESSGQYHYPRHRNRNEDPPRFLKPIVPITEETGPTVVRPSIQHRDYIQLPYSRPGVDPEIHTYGEPGYTPQGTQLNLRDENSVHGDSDNHLTQQGWPYIERGYRQPDYRNYNWNPDPEWEPSRQELHPNHQGDSPAFFNERPPSTLHQRAIPGMEWSDDHGRSGPNYPNRPYDPNAAPDEFGPGNQQGGLFPERWYVDRLNRARQTTLPPELFPPDQYGVLERRPPQVGWDATYNTGQVPMWDHPENQSPITPPRTHDNPEGQMFDRGDNPPTDNPHAVFARGENGNNYRVTDWADFRQAHDAWDMHDRRHVPRSWEGDPGSVVHGPNGPEQVQFYGVRDGTWPDWANAQVGRVVHPQEVGSQINTQDPIQVPGGPRVESPHRSWGLWQASTKESGEWTEVEEKGGHKRPKHDPEHGYGVHGVPVHEGKPHLHGRIIEHTHPDFRKADLFHWRRPVVYDRDEDRLYVGQPGMEHDEMMNHFQKPKPWGKDSMASGPSMPGYIDINGNVGEGGLHFFKDIDIPNVDELHDWVEEQHGVRADKDDPNPENADDVDVWDENDDDSDSHESSYHPTQNDEWIAEDEPVFSATLPEGRWRV